MTLVAIGSFIELVGIFLGLYFLGGQEEVSTLGDCVIILEERILSVFIFISLTLLFALPQVTWIENNGVLSYKFLFLGSTLLTTFITIITSTLALIALSKAFNAFNNMVKMRRNLSLVNNK